MVRLEEVIPVEVLNKMHEVANHEEKRRKRAEKEERMRRHKERVALQAIRRDPQRVVKLRYLFERPSMTDEEAIEARSLIDSIIDGDYVKERQSVQLEIQRWQRRLAELLPTT